MLSVLQKSPYLAGDNLSAADITFAALVSMLLSFRLWKDSIGDQHQDSHTRF